MNTISQLIDQKKTREFSDIKFRRAKLIAFFTNDLFVTHEVRHPLGQKWESYAVYSSINSDARLASFLIAFNTRNEFISYVVNYKPEVK